MFIPTIRDSSILDRQSVRRSDEAYLAERLAAADTKILVVAGDKPVITSNEARTEVTIKWFTREQLQEFGLPVGESYFLGIHPDGGARFALALTEHRARATPEAALAMHPMVDLRSLAMQDIMDPQDISLFGMAKALNHWHENARHCGHCGGTTDVKDGGWRRKCWACGKDHFPRTDPVVIMLIVDPPNDRCLLAHESRYVENMWSTLAGFLEPGEDIRHAVRREVLEEAGIEVGDVRFYLSQPWPFPHSLMIGCHGIATTTKINIDPNEIQEARWFSRAEIAMMMAAEHPENLEVPGRQAIARSLIQAFVDGEVE
ncbi:MAG: NAD(+) diphosphatase [Hyphomicrobiaceae bacterium]